MKVQGLSELVNSLQRVQGKGALGRDSQGRGGSSHRERGSHSSQDGESDASDRESFQRLLELRQKIDSEIERFAADELAQQRGLHARCEGEGPGLKVLLEDGGGNVIRRMTGEEFLQIRQRATAQMTLNRGKLLDRKL